MLIAGFGLYLLLSFYSVEKIVALLFSMAFMLNSMFISSIANRWAVGSFCWVPFTTLMSLHYLNRRDKSYLVYASMFLSLSFVGGTFQTSFFVAFITAIVLLFYPSGASRFGVRIAAVSIVGISAFLLSAIMWFPSLELFLRTLRDGGSLNSTSVYAKYTVVQRILSMPMTFLCFHFPGIAGGVQSYSLKIGAHADVTDFNGSLGFLPALFGFWGCIALRKESKLRPFIILSVCGLLFPILTPLYSILYHRFFVVASFGLCIVGAVAFQFFLDNVCIRSAFQKYLLWAEWAIGSLLAIMVIACTYISLHLDTLTSAFTKVITPMIPNSAQGVGNESWMLGRVAKTLHYYTFESFALWVPFLIALLIIVSIDRYRVGAIKKQSLLIITLLASAAQLVIFAKDWLPAVDPEKFPLYPPNSITQFLQNDSTASRYTVWRNMTKDPYILPPNTSDVFHINDFGGYESLMPPCMNVLYHKQVPEDSIDLHLLGLVNVKYIVTKSKIISPTNARKAFSADGLTIYENLLCKPRSYLAHRHFVVHSDSAIGTYLLRKDFDGSIALLMAQDTPANFSNFFDSNDSIRSGADFTRITRSENEAVELSVDTKSKAMLILTDTYYPGWKCYVNGQRREVIRTNGYMRGVSLEPGHSNVVFRFEPDTFTFGAKTSVITILIAIGTIILTNVRNRKNTN